MKMLIYTYQPDNDTCLSMYTCTLVTAYVGGVWERVTLNH